MGVIIVLVVVAVLYIPLGVVFELTKMYGGGRLQIPAKRRGDSEMRGAAIPE